jgi:HemY protein
MRALIWLLTLAALAVGLGLAARYNDGYALLVVPPWRVEVSINLLILILVGGFVLFYLLLRAIFHTLHLPVAVREFRARRRRDKAENALREALRYQFEGRFGHALRSAALAYDAGHAPGLAALLAMNAASALRDEAKCAEWRARAVSHDDEIRMARLMSEAEIAIDGRRFEDAGALLDIIATVRGRHIAALRLDLRVRQALGEWEAALHLIRQMEKHSALSADQAAPLKLRAHREWLRSLPQDAATLRRHWQALPGEARHHPQLAAEAARAFIAQGACTDAQRIIEDALEEQWDSELAALYGHCAQGDALGRIAHAEKWLHEHPQDATLLLVLGRLCRYQQLWGKAESYLEASLSQQPTRAAHTELAQLFDHLERSDAANRHYRAAATF